MAKEPERRYTTAKELADDLGRFCADQPILARWPGLTERMARWSRRHWRATATTAVLGVMMALASGGGIAQLWKEQRLTRMAFQKVQEARRREQQALLFTFTACGRDMARLVATSDSDQRTSPRFSLGGTFRAGRCVKKSINQRRP